MLCKIFTNMGRVKGNETTLHLAVSQSESLRTTVPSHIVSQFNLSPKDRLRWEMKVIDGDLKIVIIPISGYV